MSHLEPGPLVSYEQLAQIEKELDEAELETIRHQTLLTAPIYRKRKALIQNIPKFWALVLEQAPPDIEQFIQPSDSKVLVACLLDIDVTRFEIPPHADGGEAEGSSPRSVAIRFEFAENEWFEDSVLEKRFWYRRDKDGWTGLVSEPVKIRWRSKASDLSQGLTDAAVKAWEAEKTGLGPGNAAQVELERLAEESLQGSFFTWFAFRGKNVSAEDNLEALRREEERRKRVKAGEPVPASANGKDKEGEDDDDDDDDDEDIEDQDQDLVFPMGEELAIAISEDLYPGALKYFAMAQEQDDEDMSMLEGSIDSDDPEAADLRKILEEGDGLEEVPEDYPEDDEEEELSDNERPKKKARK